MSSSGQIAIENFKNSDERSYLQFARECFGADSYQACARYLSWLYDLGPYSRGRERDCWVARDEKGVVRGCIHQLRLPWRGPGLDVIVPALHNTMMHPVSRGSAGGMLILQAIKGEAHALVPGAEGAVADVLRKLGFQALGSLLWRRVLRPVAGLSAMVSDFAGFSFKPAQVSESAMRDAGACVLSSNEELAGILPLANHGMSLTFGPYWTVEALRWRFFHPLGPCSLLWVDGQRESPRGFAIVSIGRHRGVVLARVLCSSAYGPHALTRVLDIAARGSRALGAHVIQFTSEPNSKLELSGWYRVGKAPKTMIFHRGVYSVPTRFCPGAGDYGIESLLTER
jgi:hypothetical protein